MSDLKALFIAGGVITVGTILLVLAVFFLKALVIWGIGNLIVWAFAIAWDFTFWQALGVAFVIAILKGIFKAEVK